MRFLIPVILIIAAIGLFVLYTNPAYQNVQVLAAQNASYDDALSKAAQLHAVRDQLLAKENTFSPQDLSELSTILPDNVDTIRLIIDVNNIAARHNITLANVALGDIAESQPAAASTAVGTSGGPVGNVEVGFTFTTDYDTMLSFLDDLEHSQRIIDIDKLSFAVQAAGSTQQTAAQQNGVATYTIEIRTYWLY